MSVMIPPRVLRVDLPPNRMMLGSARCGRLIYVAHHSSDSLRACALSIRFDFLRLYIEG